MKPIDILLEYELRSFTKQCTSNLTLELQSPLHLELQDQLGDPLNLQVWEVLEGVLSCQKLKY
jgi:hypothetical protein